MSRLFPRQSRTPRPAPPEPPDHLAEPVNDPAQLSLTGDGNEAPVPVKESRLQSAVIDFLYRTRGWVSIRVNGGGARHGGGRYTPNYRVSGWDRHGKGWPDASFFRDGYAIHMEFKRDHTTKRSKDQLELAAHVGYNGVVIHEIRALEEAIAVVDAFEQAHGMTSRGPRWPTAGRQGETPKGDA